jgi:hypothetical protein
VKAGLSGRVGRKLGVNRGKILRCGLRSAVFGLQAHVESPVFIIDPAFGVEIHSVLVLACTVETPIIVEFCTGKVYGDRIATIEVICENPI